MAAFPLTLVGRRAGRALPLAWLLVAGRVALMLREHYAILTPHQRRRLRQLVGKSRGRPRNLSKAEREELRRIVSRLDLRRLTHNVTAMASPLPWPRHRKH